MSQPLHPDELSARLRAITRIVERANDGEMGMEGALDAVHELSDTTPQRDRDVPALYFARANHEPRMKPTFVVTSPASASDGDPLDPVLKPVKLLYNRHRG